MTLYFYALMAFGMGATVAVYLPMLSRSGQIIGSPVLANVPFFFLGMVTSFVLSLILGSRLADYGKLGAVPPWMFLAGVVSGLMILGSTFLIPRIGPGPFFVLLVAGQVGMGLVVSHFGWLGAPLDVITVRKMLGIALVVGGSYLVTFR